MTPEQQLMWNNLCNDYPKLTHQMAAKIGQADKRWLNRTANKFLGVVNTWPTEAAVRAVHTWLTVYRIPLCPGKLSNFGTFHDLHGPYILSIALAPIGTSTKKFESFPINQETIAN
jgi:hypothetical protein